MLFVFLYSPQRLKGKKQKNNERIVKKRALE